MEVTNLKKLEGLYLVIAPILTSDELLCAVKKALRGGVDIVQFVPERQTLKALEVAKDLSRLTGQFDVPFLINGNYLLAKEIKADGLHFDTYDIVPDEARRILGERCIAGYTLGNDLKRLEWAESMGADYVSFCSIFPTSSATQCETVPLETIRAAKSRTTIPIFAAGGITPKNAHLVLEAGADGIAVTSAILKAKSPEQAAMSLKEIVDRYRASVS
jgi:thiamine-phosphate pyrophosphorylase